MNAIWVARSLKPGGKSKRAGHFKQVSTWLDGSDADIAVLSAENFANISPQVLLQALRRHVPDHANSAKILAYVRPHASRYLSAYIQRTKTGQYFGSFEDFFAHIRGVDPLAYAPRFQQWRDVFGDRFTLKPFIRSELRGGDIVTDFAATILGNAAFSISRPVEENVAITQRALSGLRHVQAALRDDGVSNSHRSWAGIALANFFLPTGPVHGQKPRLDRASAQRLIDTYMDDAEALDAAFFSGPLLQTELASSLSTSIEDPIDMTVSRHFTSAEIQRLTDLGATIAEQYKGAPALWWLRHRNRHRETVLTPEQTAKIEARKDQLDKIDAGLQEVSDILRR